MDCKPIINRTLKIRLICRQKDNALITTNRLSRKVILEPFSLIELIKMLLSLCKDLLLCYITIVTKRYLSRNDRYEDVQLTKYEVNLFTSSVPRTQ